MKSLFCPISLVLLAHTATAAPSFYNVSPFGADALRCINGECEAAISKTIYQNRPAYKLTNGAVDAIVVPEIGRVMSFGKTGGPNLLWNAQPEQIAKNGWKNYGGDKLWLAPESDWKLFHGSKIWNTDVAFDGSSLKDDVLSGGKLQLTTGLSQTGIRMTRTMYFDDNGEFVIEQAARKESGAPLKASLWSITQAVPGQAIFFAVDPKTQYKDGFFRFKNDQSQTAARVQSNVIRVDPKSGPSGSKMGFDTQISALASVRDGVALVQKSARPDGQYPDGAEGAGFPTELYINSDPKKYYLELEILGPLRYFAVGDSSSHTVKWSLHDLPSTDASSPEVTAAMGKLLLDEN